MTFLEVLDTAIKIGLGAAIAGGATFITAQHKSRTDELLERKRHARTLFQQLSTSIEAVGSSISRTIHRLNASFHPSSPNSTLAQYDSFSESIEIHNHLANVQALATLIGNVSLDTRLSEYSRQINHTLEVIASFPRRENELTGALRAFNSAQNDVREAVRSLYDDNAA